MNNSLQPSAHGRILFVDKDMQMREVMKIVLKDRFQVVTTNSAEAGLQLLESETPFHIVISSFSLLWMDGLEFLRRVSELYPQTVRILTSGACPADVGQAIRQGHISRFVPKPFCMSSMREQLNNDLSPVRGGEAAC